MLEEICTLLESLALDVEDVRLSLARGVLFPAEHSGVPCLSHILNFIEKGDYPPLWSESGLDAAYEKKFDICKAALIKAVVEVSGEDKNEDVLWDETEEDQPGGAFVCRMVDWVRSYAQGHSNGRDDLVICATLSLGNLARRGKPSLLIVVSSKLTHIFQKRIPQPFLLLPIPLHHFSLPTPFCHRQLTSKSNMGSSAFLNISRSPRETRLRIERPSTSLVHFRNWSKVEFGLSEGMQWQKWFKWGPLVS